MNSLLASILAAAGVLAPVTAIMVDKVGADASFRRAHTRNMESYTFEDFVTKFSRSYAVGSDEWAKREQLFQTRKQEALNFLTGPPQSWTKGINQFADYTDAEYRAMLGYIDRRSVSTSGAAVSRKRRSAYPPVYTTKLSEFVPQQGMCGSCWAFTVTGVLEGHMRNNATIAARMSRALDGTTLSVQSLLSCTENPRKCGVERGLQVGACDGGHYNMAYEMVKQRGIPMTVDWPYKWGSGWVPGVECEDSAFNAGVTLGITGYEVLPKNNLHPMMQALYDSGAPLSVAVDSTGWLPYSGGIFSDTSDGSKGHFTIDHAVILVAYQTPHTDANGKERDGYWKIRNQWGNDWGEKGYIRIEMKKNEEEHCGWDHNSHKGIECDGDPDDVWVCGTSGVLYAASYPTGIHIINN